MEIGFPYYFNEDQYYFHSKDFEKNFQWNLINPALAHALYFY
jgi:hypothetical protein